MAETLYVSPYTLTARAPLNARASRVEYPGVLLRAGAGFACLHPWPELGDAPLPEQLAALRASAETPLLRSARVCLCLDGAARARGVSLFAGLAVPPSHATLPQADAAALRAAAEAGFTMAKRKARPEELPFLAKLIADAPLPLRLDFNETATATAIVAWLASLSPAARHQLDFLEDPCPFSATVWQELRATSGCRLAVDQAAAEATPASHDVLVIKPATDEVAGLAKKAAASAKRLVITSYMDHPFGQCHAAYHAGLVARAWPTLIEPCGLITHPLFASNAFAEQLGQGPAWQAPPGTGLGFDDLLGKLPWRKL